MSQNVERKLNVKSFLNVYTLPNNSSQGWDNYIDDYLVKFLTHCNNKSRRAGTKVCAQVTLMLTFYVMVSDNEEEALRVVKQGLGSDWQVLNQNFNLTVKPIGRGFTFTFDTPWTPNEELEMKRGEPVPPSSKEPLDEKSPIDDRWKWRQGEPEYEEAYQQLEDYVDRSRDRGTFPVPLGLKPAV